ncbi:BTAD domain-containing putative transcriptional regulator [Nocardia sp. NPDC056100]|uniref:AfsR/SARP family transcriptional regulator n=1 Tax=Nocardia sp. NPDC056100 TaxID=3345712 RepID=UPI0035DFBD25
MSEVRVVQIALLGEAQVSVTEGPARRVGGPRVRMLLALLALEPGRPVRCESLIDTIWGDDPPADPANALQTLVKRLRAVLPHGVAVEFVAVAYRLAIDADDIDIHRFVRLAGEGHELLAAGAASPAARTLDAALGLWRGAAFADLTDVPELCWHADRWNELRLDAIETRADAYLSLGRGPELAASLERELRLQPLRESLAARAIRVLAAGGRQGRARVVFESTRHLLRAELGVSPSPELARARDELDWLPEYSDSRLAVRRTGSIERVRDLPGIAALPDSALPAQCQGLGGQCPRWSFRPFESE